jgi:type II secretory pathway component PulC
LVEDHRDKLIIAVLISITFVLLVWQLINFFNLGNGSLIAPVNNDEKITYHLPTIKKAKLFGTAVNETEPSRGNLPETSLNLILRGVFTSPVQQKAAAIVESADKKASYYKVNSLLPGGYSRDTVFPFEYWRFSR